MSCVIFGGSQQGMSSDISLEMNCIVMSTCFFKTIICFVCLLACFWLIKTLGVCIRRKGGQD